MHHKFCTVDARLVPTGRGHSIGRCGRAVHGDVQGEGERAALLVRVTNAVAARHEYQLEFDRLWKEFA